MKMGNLVNDIILVLHTTHSTDPVRKLLSKLVSWGSPQVLIRSGGPGFHKLLQQGWKERSFPKESLEDEKTILKAGTLFFKIIWTHMLLYHSHKPYLLHKWPLLQVK